MRGKWTAQRDGADTWIVTEGSDEYDPIICNVWPQTFGTGRDPAELAAKIAALPDLLEVLPELLQHSISHYGRPTDETYGVGLIHAKARAALSQALPPKGEEL